MQFSLAALSLYLVVGVVNYVLCLDRPSLSVKKEELFWVIARRRSTIYYVAGKSSVTKLCLCRSLRFMANFEVCLMGRDWPENLYGGVGGLTLRFPTLTGEELVNLD